MPLGERESIADKALGVGSYYSYNKRMKAVGVKILKNQLSKYLKLVREGEVVLVTDHDEVVAELRRPAVRQVSGTSQWASFLEEEARQGRLHLAERQVSKLGAPVSLPEVDVQAELQAAREDR